MDVSEFEKGLKEFEKEVEAEMLHVSSAVMKDLYDMAGKLSPSPNNPESIVSVGSYILSFRVSQNVIETSYEIFYSVQSGIKSKLAGMKKNVDSKITDPFAVTNFSNSVPHAEDVEVGGPDWRSRGGYYVFQNLETSAKSKLQKLVNAVSKAFEGKQ